MAARILSGNTWVLIALFALLAILETLAPRRELLLSTARRWTQHALLYLAMSVSFPLIFGAGAIAVAIVRAGRPYALLSRSGLPYPCQIALWILAADLLRYGLHRLLHSIAWLWRIHLLHHSDRDFDFTDHFRAHPLEGLVARFAYLAAILLLAPSALAVGCDELIGAAFGMLEHVNFALPASAERLLRYLFVTPELHRVHHSIDEREQQRNLGVVFIWWDRLFGTYLET
ncbi:MAG TPA: sterol desaturase family protein, partial [Verrucomicrobiae bacterium]|nr:sterol desaturase family protein [Verrucomicrobiae bacterium]